MKIGIVIVIKVYVKRLGVLKYLLEMDTHGGGV